ncbi:PHP domain protein [Natronomonas moolapensis 8.8.11]|uniref:PHP domain protein n=1 Tax=Natronomonas moolapensis (strain DSM 18674 / CECT 7526 / JCM 14361 / 8.8.11) TaxID=268739 RepID=M1XKA5_NATM8|nr:PHP domain-containing protein [Natronomonas moolapensis]CCQ35544.1 PHP domain protein [Natronomonas moolapensis 8.8.11]
MVVADLHVHTRNSDGSLSLETLPDAADAAGVSTVAVTDHDRLHPDLPTPVATVDGVTVVHGIELRVATADGRIDLLGYGARRTAELTSLTERLQADRLERGAAIIDRVEDRLGIDLPIEPHEGIGRPHIAEAISTASGYSYAAAFEELIGEDCPCYLPRDVPTFEAGVAALREACSLVGLAHPYRYDDPESALAHCSALGAVERFYPYGRDVDPRAVDRAIERYDLLATGGSDAHDDRLGEAGLDADAYRAFRAAL